MSHPSRLGFFLCLLLPCPGAEPDLTLRPVAPVAVRSASGQLQCIDFGKAWFGRLVIHPDAPNKGREVTVRLGEKLGSDGRIDLRPPGSVRTLVAQIKLDADACTPALGARDARRMPASIGPVLPFRYAEIDGWLGELKPGQIEMLAAVATPFEPRGRFSSAGASAARATRT